MDVLGQVFDPIFSNPVFQLIRQLSILFYVVFLCALVFWTWRDASRRGAMAWFWGIVVAIFQIAGWAIYMVVRPPEARDDSLERQLEIKAREAEIRKSPTCPACHNPVEVDFLICPTCVKKLKKPCINCERALRLEWGVCPYCKTKQ